MEGYESAFVGDNVEEYLNKAIVGHQLIAVYKPSGLSKKIPITFDMIENGFAFDAFPDMGVYMFSVRYVDEMGIEHYIELPIDVGVDLSDAELRGNYTVSTGNDYSMSLDLYNNGYAYLYENGETRQISFNEDENGVIFFEMLGTWVYFVANDIDHVLYSLSFMGAPIGTYYASGENGDITFTVYGTYNGSDDYYAAVSGSAVPFAVTVRVYLDLENLRFGSSLVGGDRDIDPDSGNIYCDHDYEYKSVGADCYNGAYEESWCTRCGKYNREERSEALGHEYNDEGCCTRCGENNTNGRVQIEALREQTRASMYESFNSIPQVTGEQQQTFTKFLDRLGTAANEKDIIIIRDEFETFIRNIEAESKTKVVDYWETNFNEPYELKVGEDLSEYASTYVGKAVTIYFTNGTAYSCDLTAENISFDGTSENVGNEVLICFTVWVDGEGYTFTFPVYVVE